MKKEQHIYKIQDGEKGIVYIFNITRREHSVSLESIWLVVVHNGLETKIVLDIPGLMAEMLMCPESAADTQAASIIKKWFSDMELAKDELLMADMEEEITDLTNIDVEGKTDYSDIVKDLLDVPKKYH